MKSINILILLFSNPTEGMEEMDIAITSHLCSCMHRGELTASQKKSEQSPRKAVRINYLFGGFEVCRDFFLYVHGINTKAFKNTIKHFKECGVSVRIHKDQKRNKKFFDI